ncbi:LemA family protein [Mycoplasma nasistruthionis]|uniref:LemA family protein n=1 Tax=Mycoplasma nasistruthionis TaxID=353852 RepID=A0A5B7XUC1_9MOLU|nr:LemA family protein [Mycoplasma nasistruthionis]QCZ36469.1 LemA family protein [Mycoplasma nasistruthionis]
MANLFDNTTVRNEEGFQPVADNRPVKATASLGAKIFIYASFILIFPIFWYIGKRNAFNRMQNQINNLASGIDVQLQKRSDTLGKLVQQVASYKNFEKEVFSDVAKLRSLTLQGNAIANSQEIDALNNSVFGRVMAVAENYPELKSSSLYMNLMDETTYIEREIAASRRLYNQKVTEFNQEIMVFPSNVPAAASGLSTAPLFQASVKSRQDVDMSILN